MTDYDLERLVELGVMLQTTDERRERALQLAEGRKTVDTDLTNGDARKQALDIMVEAGVPLEYATRAMERLYPDSSIVQAVEKRLGVQPSSQIAVQESYIRMVQLAHPLMAGIVQKTLGQFPTLALHLLNLSRIHHKKGGESEETFSSIKLISPDLIFAGPLSYCEQHAVKTTTYSSLFTPLDYLYGAYIRFSLPSAPPSAPAKKSWLDWLLFPPMLLAKPQQDLGLVRLEFSRYNAWSEHPRLTFFQKPNVRITIYDPSFLLAIAEPCENHKDFCEITMVRHYPTTSPST